MIKRKKHIVLVSIDTLRADCIAASPRANAFLSDYHVTTKLQTGPFDAILREGVYFNNCFSAAPYTSASHAAYFTGQWPRHNGIYEFFNRKLSTKTIFEYAREQGYSTIFQTDFPIILGPYLGISAGVDHYFVEAEEKALAMLKKQSENPTLSFFHFAGVHYPYGFHTLKFGGKDYLRKVQELEKKYHIARLSKHKLDDILDETFRSKKDTELLFRYKYIIQKLYGEAKYDDLFELYLEGINYFMKHRFQAFMKQLKDFVDKENAMLFLFADHGEEWNATSEGHHNSLSDNVLRVPLVVYEKGIRSRIDNTLVRTIDIAPAIANMMEKPFSTKNMDGIPLDMYGNKNSSARGNDALAQVWMSKATKRQIASYQKATMKRSAVKPLKTYLFGEVIRTQSQKIALYYNKQRRLLHKEQEGKGLPAEIRRLRRALKVYNASQPKKVKKILSLKNQLRNELNNLGYRV